MSPVAIGCGVVDTTHDELLGFSQLGDLRIEVGGDVRPFWMLRGETYEVFVDGLNCRVRGKGLKGEPLTRLGSSVRALPTSHGPETLSELMTYLLIPTVSGESWELWATAP